MTWLLLENIQGKSVEFVISRFYYDCYENPESAA